MRNVTIHTPDEEKKLSTLAPPKGVQRSLSGRTLMNYEERKFKREHVWESCCLRADARMCRYLTKSFFALCILSFCGIGILTNDDPCSSNLQFYYSCVSLIIGGVLEQQSSSSSSTREDSKKWSFKKKHEQHSNNRTSVFSSLPIIRHRSSIWMQCGKLFMARHDTICTFRAYWFIA